ncbi:MAG: hypothetical protein HYS23_04115 [Geobacter sp.]|nr:hypothetical protein [Geobacter sp.]
MNYRIHFAAILIMLATASVSYAMTRDEAVSAVTGRYRITAPAFLGGFKEIGSVLTPRREGLRANRPSKAFRPNLVKNHQFAAAGGGDLPLGGVHEGALKPGERLYLYEVRTGDDYVQLDLFTVATYVVPGSGTRGPTPLQASVRFQYGGGLAGVTAGELLADIGEWLAIEGEPRLPAVESRPAAIPQPAAAPVDPRGADRATATIRLGQTQEEVTAILGPPEKQILLGAKTIFVYRDVKVVFVDGKVADAE